MSGGGSRRATLSRDKDLAAGAGQTEALNAKENFEGRPHPDLLREISEAWQVLESSGFPPEACGWPSRDMKGVLPEAIECALDCLIRQRNDLLSEVIELRKLRASSAPAA